MRCDAHWTFVRIRTSYLNRLIRQSHSRCSQHFELTGAIRSKNRVLTGPCFLPRMPPPRTIDFPPLRPFFKGFLGSVSGSFFTKNSLERTLNPFKKGLWVVFYSSCYSCNVTRQRVSCRLVTREGSAYRDSCWNGTKSHTAAVATRLVSCWRAQHTIFV